jgi:putative transposase
MTQTLAFQFALAPTREQEQQFKSHIGAARFAYNWAIHTVSDNWKQVKLDSNIPYISTSFYSLRKLLNEQKDGIAPWWKENSKEAFATGTATASTALQNWFRARKTGKKVGFPRYKNRETNSSGIIFTSTTVRLEDDNKHFTLPRIGTVKICEKQKALRWLIEQGGRITSATLSYKHAQWVLSVNIKVEDDLALQYFNGRYTRKTKANSVGIDVGLKVFITDSNGNVINNPQHLRNLLTKLRKANKRLAPRKGLNKKTGEMPSARYEKAKHNVQKVHAKIYNTRNDFLHKTSKTLVEENALIGVEDLNVQGMIKNKHLSLSISDAGWGEFKRQLKYKAVRYGSVIIEIDRFYPSSKKCSDCGTVKAKLSLAERTYKCDNCGLSIDRDYNAALNIEKEAVRLYHVAQSCGETLNERGDNSSGSELVPSETIVNETLSDAKTSQVIKDSYFIY